jgi:hypothetical protein
VEVLIDESIVGVRDSNFPAVSIIRFTHEEWREFVKGVKAGEFDLPKA